MYLVSACTLHDNIPLKLFAKRDDAVWFAEGHAYEIPQRILDLYSIDADLLGFEIVDFSSAGEVERRDVVRWLEDETTEG
jgi:hypothetical protein